MLGLFKGNKIRMVWKILAKDKASYLIGTTHMFCYNFSKSLRGFIKKSESILFECSLDEQSLRRVSSAGLKKSNLSLYDFVDKELLEKLAQAFLNALKRNNLTNIIELDYSSLKKAYLEDIMKVLKNQAHWASFFTIWYDFLSHINWKFSMDLKAQSLAREMKKDIFFLEEPEEQIQAMEGMPPERILHFFRQSNNWIDYTEKFSKLYLKGKIHELMKATVNFPTRCESIIERRDPVLFERMLPFIRRGNALILVGITHVPGLLRFIQQEGLKISPHER